MVTDAIEHAGLEPGADVAVAIDVAANQIHTADGYRLDLDHVTLDASEWLTMVDGWRRQYPVVSVEDVLAEDEWENWSVATKTLGIRCQLLGDDLFATNAERLDHGIHRSVANAVLVKPNQAGTVTRARNVVAQARAAGYATVISARSGDTEDDWLADLAVGWNTG